MNLADLQYWPFEVVPPERQTEQHRREIQFLEAAYQARYRPYEFGWGSFGATAAKRTGEIIYRGCRGKHWEVILGITHATVPVTTTEPPADLAAEDGIEKVPTLLLKSRLVDFDYAADAVLRWLRGIEATAILEHVRGHLFVDRTTSPGFVFYRKETGQWNPIWHWDPSAVT